MAGIGRLRNNGPERLTDGVPHNNRGESTTKRGANVGRYAVVYCRSDVKVEPQVNQEHSGNRANECVYRCHALKDCKKGRRIQEAIAGLSCCRFRTHTHTHRVEWAKEPMAGDGTKTV